MRRVLPAAQPRSGWEGRRVFYWQPVKELSGITLDMNKISQRKKTANIAFMRIDLRSFFAQKGGAAMSEEKKWNEDEMLDIGGMDGNDFDPFGDDDFEVEVQNYEEQKAEEKKAEQKVPPKKEESKKKAPENPLAAEILAAEEKDAETARDGLFSKPPVFSYAGVTEEVEDPSITFDELRISKKDDFPELEDGKRVSWTIEYGKIKKPVPTPQKKTAAECKKEIETSKEFLDSLKKAKDKAPVCKLIPKVTAQSKGTMPAYKGIFTSYDEADAGGKVISLFPSGDGKVYEMRKTEIGRFITPISQTKEIRKVEAGFTPVLPLIPAEKLMVILCFFKHMARKGNFEALVNIYWDKQESRFVLDVPEQKVTRVSVSSRISEKFDSERYIHYVDIHSHNNMNAFFSRTDDKDEKAARVYAVVGKVSSFLPEIKARIASSRSFVEIDPSVVFEGIVAVSGFPEEWKSAVLIDDSLSSVKEDFLKQLAGSEGL